MKKTKKIMVHTIWGLLALYLILSGLVLKEDPLSNFIVHMTVDYFVSGKTLIGKKIKFLNKLIIKVPSGNFVSWYENGKKLHVRFGKTMAFMTIKEVKDWSYNHPSTVQKIILNGREVLYIKPEGEGIIDAEIHYFYEKELKILITFINACDKQSRSQVNKSFFSILNNTEWIN